MKEIVVFQKEDKKRRISGKAHGKTSLTRTSLPKKESAVQTLTRPQQYVLFILATTLAFCLAISWHNTMIGILIWITLYYAIDIVLNIYILMRSILDTPEIAVTDEELTAYPNDAWPSYTILCPLYKEFAVMPQFIEAMEALDYPKDKLRIMLLLERDDKECIQWVQSRTLPPYFHMMIVPPGGPKTKPKAINYGLQQIQSEFVVVYDAEDIPEPDQLKKAILAFAQRDDKTICMQAKLHFYNDDQNLLTVLFNTEYFLWFDAKLTGLYNIDAPIPLGGTSNHFKTSYLRAVGGWDAYNVAEDCDLGMRIVKRGFKTAIVDSITYEEANSEPRNWLRQRTRWIKGYFQTYLVHMRHPMEFIKNSSWKDFFLFQMMVGGKTFSLLLNPLLWLITILYFTLRPIVGETIESFFPVPVLYLSVLCIVIGNFHYLYQYMMIAGQKKQYWLIKYTMFVPFYWLAMSIAAFVAMYELFAKPFYWAKTIHGLHLPQEEPLYEPKPPWDIRPAAVTTGSYTLL